MRSNEEISERLRYLADLYFARHSVTNDNSFQVRGFAFAKAAEAVVATKQPVLGVMPTHCRGLSVQTAIKEIAETGRCSRETALQMPYEIPEGLQELEELPGVTRPFLFVLWQTFGATNRDELVDALPKVKQHNETVYFRLYSALLADAQANMRLNHYKLEGTQTGRFQTKEPNLSMGCSVGKAVCSECGDVIDSEVFSRSR
jgi:DNA polymerase/3'-5' exonuclease PolX